MLSKTVLYKQRGFCSRNLRPGRQTSPGTVNPHICTVFSVGGMYFTLWFSSVRNALMCSMKHTLFDIMKFILHDVFIYSISLFMLIIIITTSSLAKGIQRSWDLVLRCLLWQDFFRSETRMWNQMNHFSMILWEQEESWLSQILKKFCEIFFFI